MVLHGLSANPLDTPPEERERARIRSSVRLTVYQVDKSRIIACNSPLRTPSLPPPCPMRCRHLHFAAERGQARRQCRRDEMARARNRQSARQGARCRREGGALPRLVGSSEDGDQRHSRPAAQRHLARTCPVRGDRPMPKPRRERARCFKKGGNVDTLTEVRRLDDDPAAQGEPVDDVRRSSPISPTTHLDGHRRSRRSGAACPHSRSISSPRRARSLQASNAAATSRFKGKPADRQLNALKATTAKAGEDEVGLKALEREAASQRQLLDLSRALPRAASRQDSKATPADARIVSSALVPTIPYFPKCSRTRSSPVLLALSSRPWASCCRNS